MENIYNEKNLSSKKFSKKNCGLTEELVRKISKDKGEPEWMLKKRLQGLKYFLNKEIPNWGPNLKNLNLDEIIYYVDPNSKQTKNWSDVPKDVKETFEKLGIPKAEREVLSGVGAQYDSSVVYHNLKEKWKKLGVIFEGFDLAVKKYPELVKKYFMNRCVPIFDHKFASLHAAVFSGGTFIYVPENVEVEIPLQAYFRMNQRAGGQFEHTLIIAKKNSKIHYIEGCSAPRYVENSLHSGCVELFVEENAVIKYSSIENWSRNTYNLNTKRAVVLKNGKIEWLNGNVGSGCTMLYPCSVLLGDNSKSESLTIAFASKKQNQDSGTKVIHIGKNTSSIIKAKSISDKGGISTYRGLVKVLKCAENSKSSIECDALMLDELSVSNTYPKMEIERSDAQVLHEAKAGKITDKEIFYLKSRGFTEDKAKEIIVCGFTNEVIKKLPLEYAAEFNRLIELEMDGNLG